MGRNKKNKAINDSKKRWLAANAPQRMPECSKTYETTFTTDNPSKTLKIISNVFRTQGYRISNGRDAFRIVPTFSSGHYAELSLPYASQNKDARLTFFYKDEKTMECHKNSRDTLLRGLEIK